MENGRLSRLLLVAGLRQRREMVGMRSSASGAARPRKDQMPKRRVSGKPISEQSVETFGAGCAGAHLTAPSKPLATTLHPALQREPVRSTITLQALSIAAQGSCSTPVSMYFTLIKIENLQLNPSWLPLPYA